MLARRSDPAARRSVCPTCPAQRPAEKGRCARERGWGWGEWSALARDFGRGRQVHSHDLWRALERGREIEGLPFPNQGRGGAPLVRSPSSTSSFPFLSSPWRATPPTPSFVLMTVSLAQRESQSCLKPYFLCDVSFLLREGGVFQARREKEEHRTTPLVGRAAGSSQS